jgi:diaminopimelate decarboxylase
MNKYQKSVNKLIAAPVKEKSGQLLNVYKQALALKNRVLNLTAKEQTPFYLFDPKSVKEDVFEFKKAFAKHLAGFQAYYALKANPYPELLKIMIASGLGLDVSSGRELKLALKCGAKKIIFTGPGKTLEELQLAINQRAKLIILMDSFGEMKRLGELLKGQNIKVRAGIRIFTKYHGPWTKFGIDLKDLAKFWQAAKKYPQIELQGIHCHMSWSETVKPYELMIGEIGNYLRKYFTEVQKKQIKFIDLGGGFTPGGLDGYYPWTLPQGEIKKIVADYFGQQADFKAKYYLTDAVSPENFAKGIARAIKNNFQDLDCQYFFEPGRMLASKAMHFVFRVIDVKDSNRIILDGGINMAGWESYQYNYCPLINLTQPSTSEISANFYGSLCAPDDLLGHYCYAKNIKEGDVLIMPNQGAYTFTWAQNFIKPIPPVVKF